MSDSNLSKNETAAIRGYLDQDSGTPEEVGAVWATIQARVQDGPAAAAPQKQYTRAAHTRPMPRRTSVQSVMHQVLWIVPVVAAVAWYQLRDNTGGATPASEYTTYTTRPGQRASITLGDGSRVTLGAATTLRLNKNAGTATDINAEISGEALFNVAPAAGRSFTVTSHGVTTRVLGTEFVVRGYDASNVRVAVRDGRVSVQSPLFPSSSSAIVNAGEGVSVTQSALPVVAQMSDIATDFAWANGELVLRDVPLAEAFARLSRWYGREFKISDSALLQSRLNGVLPSELSREKIDVIARAIGARAEYSQGTITFVLEK